MSSANDARLQQFFAGLTFDEKNSCIENNQLLELVQICKGGTTSSMSRQKGRQERVSGPSMMEFDGFTDKEGDETEATASA